MNDRIQELLAEADAFAESRREYNGTDAFLREYNHRNDMMEKFAELIIRECAKQVKDFYQETEFTCYGAESEILSHFGME